VTSKFFVIIADQIDNTQRSQIQLAVKGAAESWWHEFLDVWIVKGGESASYWRDLLSVIVGPGASGLLVLSLPETKKTWSSRMGTGKTDWLHENYTGIRSKDSGASSGRTLPDSSGSE
jgi:hypothetical protein